MADSLCIVGGGASGVALAWCLAKVRQLGLPGKQFKITLLHDQPQLSGHSFSVPVTVNGVQRVIDLGVQMIAPSVYPNLNLMLQLPEFLSVHLSDVSLKISCAFPPQGANTPYWGNFPAYQTTPLYQSGAQDCATFEASLGPALLLPGMTVDDFLMLTAGLYQDLTAFENFFLDPYMSIMNGYGQALLGTVKVTDIAPLFDLGYAKFSVPGKGFKRFTAGSVAWVNAMYNFAKAQLGTDLTVVYKAKVDEVYPSNNGPTVQWQEGNQSKQQTFDVVAITTDMATAGNILDNATNSLRTFYANYTGQSVWNLVPGYCYLHTDDNILAPGLPKPPEETLQFTAYWATQQTPYDLVTTFTTYIERNLMGVTDPDFNYYLTMYGFDPNSVAGVPIPAPNTWIQPTPLNWTHGMWLPSFMLPQKQQFHVAQSTSQFYPPYPYQNSTGIFFAGNNLTMDSEEGALVSAMALAKYAFGIDAPSLFQQAWGVNTTLQVAFATAEYAYLYNLMFPSSDFGLLFTVSVLQDLAGQWQVAAAGGIRTLPDGGGHGHFRLPGHGVAHGVVAGMGAGPGAGAGPGPRGGVRQRKKGRRRSRERPSPPRGSRKR